MLMHISIPKAFAAGDSDLQQNDLLKSLIYFNLKTVSVIESEFTYR